MRALDGFSFKNQGAGTLGPYQVQGGKYMATVSATFGGGNVELQRLAADGSTYVPIRRHQEVWNGTASVNVESNDGNYATAGAFPIDLAPGTYQVVITTASAVYFNLSRIPGE